MSKMDITKANFKEKSLQDMEVLLPAYDIDMGDSSLTSPVRNAIQRLWRRVVDDLSWSSCYNITDFITLKRLYNISNKTVHSYINATGDRQWWYQQRRWCESAMKWVGGCIDKIYVELLPESATESKHMIEGLCKGIVNINDNLYILIQSNSNTLRCLALKCHGVVSIKLSYIDPDKDCSMYIYTHENTQQLKAVEYLGHALECMINGVGTKRVEVLPEFSVDSFEGIFKVPTDWSKNTKTNKVIELKLVESDGSCDGCVYNGDEEACKTRVVHCRSGNLNYVEK